MKYSREYILEDLNVLVEAGLIDNSQKNLRSKIDSILRSLENLSEKKLRIEYEIKKQKRSLERKRIELKKVSKSTNKKISSAIESGSIQVSAENSFGYLDNYLLQESIKKLED